MLLENIITIEGTGQEFEDFYQKIERYSLDERDMTFKMDTFIPLETLSEFEQRGEAREKWGPKMELRCIHYHLARNEDSSIFTIEAQSIQLSPRPFLENLSKMYPSLTMNIAYIATTIGGYGEATYRNGVTLRDAQYRKSGPSYFEKAHEAFGYNREELEELFVGDIL